MLNNFRQYMLGRGIVFRISPYTLAWAWDCDIHVNSSIVDEWGLVKKSPLQDRGPIRSNLISLD